MTHVRGRQSRERLEQDLYDLRMAARGILVQFPVEKYKPQGPKRIALERLTRVMERWTE